MAKIIGKIDKILFIIIVAASLVRFVGLGNRVVGLTGDEAAFGYDAFSILKQGTDEFGKKFPLYFQSIGDYKYPVYVYLSTIPVAIFGLTEFSTRFLSALSGVGLVFVIYYFVFLYTKNRRVSLLAALFLAISPWHIIFSRGAYEANLGLTISVTSIYFYKKFFVNKKKRNLLLSLCFFVLAIYSYSAYRIFLPVVFMAMFFIETKNWKNWKTGLFAVFTFIVVLMSFIPGESRARVNSLTGSSNTYLAFGQDELIFEDGLSNPGNTLWTRVFHNKIVIYGQKLAASYFNQLNPDFWFINGDKTRTYYNIPDTGLLYFLDAPFLILGCVFLYSKYRKLFFTGIVILAIGILPSSLVNELPSSIRLLPSLPAFIIFSASGAYLFLKSKFFFSKFIKLFTFFFFIFLIGYFFHMYISHSGFHEPYNRDYGADTLVSETKGYLGKYNAIVMTDDPYIFFLFYNKILPSDFLKTANLNPGGPGKWERVNSFGKYIFKMGNACPKVGKLNVLYVCKGPEVPQNARVVAVIRYTDNLPEFTLIQFYPLSQFPSPLPTLPSRLKYMVETDKRNDGLILSTEKRFW